MKPLKTTIVVSTVAATTLALAQTVVPQKPAADQGKGAPAATAATGGQTSGAGQTSEGRGGIAGVGVGATIAIAAGVLLVIAAASDGGGGGSTTSHRP